jgi:hypothetical protein
VCEPVASVSVVCGELHAAKAPWSSRHWKLTLSFAENVNVGVGSLVSPEGPESIVVSGPVVSTAKLRLAGVGSTFPATSIARTWKLCAPSVSGAVVWGEVHAAKAPASTRHPKLAFSFAEKAKVGVGSFVGPEGPESIVVSGGVVSGVPSEINTPLGSRTVPVGVTRAP